MGQPDLSIKVLNWADHTGWIFPRQFEHRQPYTKKQVNVGGNSLLS